MNNSLNTIKTDEVIQTTATPQINGTGTGPVIGQQPQANSNHQQANGNVTTNQNDPDDRWDKFIECLLFFCCVG